MVLYELLALEPPYFGIKAFVISKSAAAGQLPPLPPYIILQQEYAPLVSLLRACTDFDPTKRPTALQVLNMLGTENTP
jgi:serine/threonine protein kinase